MGLIPSQLVQSRLSGCGQAVLFYRNVTWCRGTPDTFRPEIGKHAARRTPFRLPRIRQAREIVTPMPWWKVGLPVARFAVPSAQGPSSRARMATVKRPGKLTLRILVSSTP